jgi:hypothetical protein
MKPSRYIHAHLALLMSMSIAATAQQARQLSIIDSVQLPEQQEHGLAVMMPMKCSASGELYVRFSRGDRENGVTVVSEDRQHVVHLSPSQVPDMIGSSPLDFAPGLDHDAFLLVVAPRSPVAYYIVTLKDNAASTVTRLDTQPGLELHQFAVLGADHFVISGYFRLGGEGPKPFTGIFDSRGQLQKEIALPGDLDSKAVAKSKLMPESQSAEDGFAGWLEVSSLQTADDGSVYVTRHGPEGPVFLISAGGTVRRVRLRPPEKAATLASVKINGGSLVAEYYMPGSASGGHRVHYLVVTDLSSGNPQETIQYEGIQSTGVGMVCYRENTFEFLSQAPDGHLQIVRGR